MIDCSSQVEFRKFYASRIIECYRQGNDEYKLLDLQYFIKVIATKYGM
jgi:hypothetical protein